MSRDELNLLMDVLRASKATHPILCVVGWNGFEAGHTYQAECDAYGLQAKDKDGITTSIGYNACAFFEVGAPVPAKPTAEEQLAEQQAQNAATLRQLGAYLTAERPTFNQAQLVKWIPGMCNRRIPSENALMYVIEQTNPQEVRQDGLKANPNDIELVDLRVAALACSARDDEQHIVEVMVDSRRVQLWGQ